MGRADGGLGDKIALLLKALNLSRSAAAARLAVDKSLVRRWVSGAVRPSEHNLARLTDLARQRWPEFSLARWESPVAEFALALGLSAKDAEPAATAAPHAGAAPVFPVTMAESRGRVAADGAAYAGMFRTYSCFAANAPILAQSCARVEQQGDSLLCTSTVGNRVFRGPMLLGRDINTVLWEDDAGNMMPVFIAAVRGAKAAFLDGILMTTVGHRAPTVTAFVFASQRVHDIDADSALNERHWAALVEDSRRVSAARIPLADLPAEMRALLENTVGAPRAGGRVDHVLALPAERSIAVGHAGMSRTAIFDAARAVIEARLAAGAAAKSAADQKAGKEAPVGAMPVAVLPFTTFGDEGLKAVADAFVEDLTTSLARVEGLTVASRLASFQHRGSAADLRAVAAALRVRYIVEGSLRRFGDRLRLNVQLVEAAAGSHLWAETFDRRGDGLLADQDEIVRAVVSAAPNRILLHESAAAPESLDGMLLRARGLTYELTARSLGDAIALTERIVAERPGDAVAHRVLGINLAYNAFLGFAADWRKQLERAERMTTRAVALDDKREINHHNVGMVAYMRRDHERAMLAFRRALEINPNFHYSTAGMGMACAWAGKPDEAIAHTEAALRLYPRDPLIFLRYVALAAAHFVRGRPEDALSWAQKSLQQRRACLPAHLLRMACQGQLGDRAAAERARAELRESFPRCMAGDLERLPFVRDSDRETLAAAIAGAGCELPR